MPFEKGHPGGPGRPVGSENTPLEFKNKSLKQICKELTVSVALPQLKTLAKKGQIEAIKLLLGYGYGLPVQQVHQVNINMDYSSWSDEQIEEFEDTGKMPMLQQGQEPEEPPNKEVK